MIRRVDLILKMHMLRHVENTGNSNLEDINCRCACEEFEFQHSDWVLHSLNRSLNTRHNNDVRSMCVRCERDTVF